MSVTKEEFLKYFKENLDDLLDNYIELTQKEKELIRHMLFRKIMTMSKNDDNNVVVSLYSKLFTSDIKMDYEQWREMNVNILNKEKYYGT